MNIKFPNGVTQFNSADGSVFHAGGKGVLFIGDRDPAEFLRAGFTAVDELVVDQTEPAPTIITDDKDPSANQQIPQQLDSHIVALEESVGNTILPNTLGSNLEQQTEGDEHEQQ